MRVIEGLTDVEIAEAHRSAEMYAGIELMTGDLDGFASFMQALDWLNLNRGDKPLVKLWIDGQFGDPIAIARGRAEPAAGRAKEEEVEGFKRIWRDARTLIVEERFLNWQIAFPGVWENWNSVDRHGGFDAIVGNPPWDRIKLQQVEWFAARRPEIALAQRASDRSKMIARLKEAGDTLFSEFQKADARATATMRMARQNGHYPLLSRGDINLYSLFVERSHALVKRDGMVGLLTPSGIVSDLSASAFIRKLTTGGHVRSIYDFENRRSRYGLEPFFPDVDTRFKFAAVTASPQRRFDAAACSFFVQAVEELLDPERAFPVKASVFNQVNPNTGTAPIFRSRRDMALTTAIYERLPVLVDRSSPAQQAAWPVRYATMFHMTNDSGLFRTRAELEENEGAFSIGANRYGSSSGDWVPLYEGKMVQAFDHRAAGVIVNPANPNRPAQPFPATLEQHQEPGWVADPQFWVQPPPGLASQPYALGYKDVTAPTNVRSMIAAIIPTGAAGNTLPLLDMEAGAAGSAARSATLLLANLNTIVFDYIARQKIQGQHLNWFIVEQLPVIPPQAYAAAIGQSTAGDIVAAAAFELTYTAHDLAEYARDMGHCDGAGDAMPPFAWDESRRLMLRAKLDALYFILYGVFDPIDPARSRDDIRYIYSTFPIVEREEVARWGSYRSCDLCLAWINALMAGQPDADVRVG